MPPPTVLCCPQWSVRAYLFVWTEGHQLFLEVAFDVPTALQIVRRKIDSNGIALGSGFESFS